MVVFPQIMVQIYLLLLPYFINISKSYLRFHFFDKLELSHVGKQPLVFFIAAQLIFDYDFQLRNKSSD